MTANKKTKAFTCSYHHDGAKWGITLHAYDMADAEARCKKLGYLHLDGEVVAMVPARIGFLARLSCAVRNLRIQLVHKLRY